MSEDSRHGTMFLDPNRGFIQVRENYFVLKEALRRRPNEILRSGHFANAYNDAKNNIPDKLVTPRDLQKMINVEEVGLENIPQAYQDEEGEWWIDDPRPISVRRAMKGGKNVKEIQVEFGREEAIDLTIKLWNFLKRTGKIKENWPDWNRYGVIENLCFLCEYTKQEGGRPTHFCGPCPYFEKFGRRCFDDNKEGMYSIYYHWEEIADTPEERKEYAGEFLKELEELLEQQQEDFKAQILIAGDVEIEAETLAAALFGTDVGEVWEARRKVVEAVAESLTSVSKQILERLREEKDC